MLGLFAGELFLVMEYVQGESLGKLIIAASERDETIPPKIAITILIQALWGLHAAHEAKTPRGESLGIIHRDVSPQNILVGDDGVVRIVDFGVAKAAWRAQSTREGQLKGKIAYMPPEQLRSEANQDRRVDVYAASVCLWEALTGRRYIENEVPTVMIRKLLALVPDAPSKHARGLPRAIDAIVLRGLARSPADRFTTAHDMATHMGPPFRCGWMKPGLSRNPSLSGQRFGRALLGRPPFHDLLPGSRRRSPTRLGA